MRTDSQNKKSEVCNADSTASKDTMKAVRKTLHPLQVAAGDKENLVGAGRMPSTLGEKEPKDASMCSKITDNVNSPKREKKKSSKVQEKKITVEDLTSEEGPSEHYWEILAETRRRALEKALIENQQLNEHVAELKEKIEKYKELLKEAQDIIDVLNEIVDGTNEEGSGVEEDTVRRP